MKFRRAVCCLLALLVLACAASAGQPRYLEITFLSTNDLHAHDRPFTFPADPKRNIPAAPDVGGMARIAAVVRQTRAETSTPVFLLDSGDTTHGYSALAKAFHGGATIAIMNAMAYDAMVPGNHEFQWPAADPVRNLQESRFPWVCANLVYAETGEFFAEPYVLRDLGGARVAFFGLTNELINTQPQLYVAGQVLGLKVLKPVETAAKLVPELRKKADVVVLLSHLGVTPDVQLAQAVPGIDIILGAHTHTTLSQPRMVSTGQPSAFSIAAVPVVQAGYYGTKMGRTKLIFRSDGSGHYTLMSCKGALIPINNSIPDDPEVAGIIQDFTKRLPPPPPKPPLK